MAKILKKLTILLLIAVLALCVGLLVACDNGEGTGNGKRHTHPMTKTDAVNATCTEAGNIAYWYCSECDKYFSDAEGKNEIAENEWVKKATGHTYSTVWSSDDYNHWHQATCEHSDEIKDKDEHSFNDEQKCTVCDYELTYSVGLYFSLNDDGQSYYVSNVGSCYSDSDIVIPATFNGLPVTGIGYEAFSNCSRLVNITIPSSIKFMATFAFYGCGNLERVYFTGSIAEWCEIEFVRTASANPVNYSHALYVDNKLVTDLVIPETVTEIKDFAFVNSEIKSVSLPEMITSIGEEAFSGCQLNEAEIPLKLTSLGKKAYAYNPIRTIRYNAETLENYTFGTGSDGSFAFLNSPKDWNGILVTVGANVQYIPNLFKGLDIDEVYFASNSVCTAIRSSAFQDCRTLRTINLPNSVNYIDSYAFNGCVSLVSIALPSALEEIGYQAFWGCSKLVEVFNPSKLELRGGSYDDNGGLGARADNIYTPTEGSSKLLSWNDYLFYFNNNKYYLMGYNDIYCDELNLPDGVYQTGIKIASSYEIYNYAFAYRKDTSVKFPDNITTIQDYMFSGCGFTEFEIPNTITKIGNGAFENCSKLTKITIPNTLISIGMYAFDGCKNLDYNVYDNACYLGNDTNPYLALIKIQNNNVTEFTTHPETRILASRALGSGNGSIQTVVIGNKVSIIRADIFYNFYVLTSVTLGNGVKTIESGAFWNCSSLERITIPSSVTYIGEVAFTECHKLTTVNIPSSVTYIGRDAFSGCASLTSVTFSNSNGWRVEGTIFLPNGNVVEYLDLQSSALQNTSTAAKYLRDTYCGCKWTRS